MVRLDRQDIAAALLRFGQSPRAQMLDRGGEQVAAERCRSAPTRRSERARGSRAHCRFALLAGGPPVLAVHTMPSPRCHCAWAHASAKVRGASARRRGPITRFAAMMSTAVPHPMGHGVWVPAFAGTTGA